jgi:hypothetical protein
VLLQAASGAATNPHLSCYNGATEVLPVVAGAATKIHWRCYHGSSALLQAPPCCCCCCVGGAVSGSPATAVVDGGVTPACADGDEAERCEAQREKEPLHRQHGTVSPATPRRISPATPRWVSPATPRRVDQSSAAVLHVRRRDSVEDEAATRGSFFMSLWKR